jgi:hypothetical protein
VTGDHERVVDDRPRSTRKLGSFLIGVKL